MLTQDSPAANASVRDVQRRLAGILPEARPTAEGAPLEFLAGAMEPPRCVQAVLLEGHALRAIRVEGDPVVGFAGFLDGTQRTHVAGYLRGLPIVHGTVGAVVRVRRNRRMVTWPRGPRIARLLCAPRALLAPAEWEALESLGLPLHDASASEGGQPLTHPLALLERARGLVEYERELAEQALAADWCATEHETLFVDGGISGSERIAASSCVVGVVKSHRTLHAEGDAIATILALRAAQRSSVFRISPARRSPVASWYLRLREPAGHDPLWGLVRVEVAETHDLKARPELMTARANEVSRWLLAEVSPLALPDSRWDKMVYGIRDCEEFLRAAL